MPRELCAEFKSIQLEFLNEVSGVIAEMEPTLEQEIRKGQLKDERIKEVKELLEAGKSPNFSEDEQGTVWYKDRICVPDVKPLRQLILSEAYDTAYSIHPGSSKMYQDLKQ